MANETNVKKNRVSMKQFFKNMFSSKAKRKEAKRLEEEAMINEGKVVIDIEKSDRKNTSAKEKRQKKKLLKLEGGLKPGDACWTGIAVPIRICMIATGNHGGF